MEMVRDHRSDIETTLDHRSHLIPRLIHLAAVDALNREHVEYDFVPVHSRGLGHDAKHGDAAAVRHVIDHIIQRLWVAGHF